MRYNPDNSEMLGVRLNHETYDKVTCIHDYRKNYIKRNITLSETLRILLRIGIKSYTDDNRYKKYLEDKLKEAKQEQEAQSELMELQHIKELQELFGMQYDEPS